MAFFKNIALICTALLLTSCASSPPNLGEVKTQITAYKNSGEYQRDFDAKIRKAEKYIVKNASDYPKSAIVLDIDETSLSNWSQLRANDYSFFLKGPCEDMPDGPCGLKAWQIRAEAKAFPSTLHLYKTAQKHNVAVFFITGRMEGERDATTRNLKAAGYDGWKELILRASVLKHMSATDYKSAQRKRIEEKGYKIIANIGDQPSDLAGGYAEKTFLLPNPFYRIP